MEKQRIFSSGASRFAGLTKDAIARALAARPVCHSRSDALVSQRLAQAPSLAGDACLTAPAALTAAAVLVPLIDRAEGMTVLLTQRTAHLANHGGQISFPGGRVERDDADSTDAALRETMEEIGLDRGRISILGRLDDYVTVTGFLVAPVVGFVQPPFALAPDPFEVEEIFEVPLGFILDPDNHQRHSRAALDGATRYFYAITYGERYIWGATAAMLINLYEALMPPCAS